MQQVAMVLWLRYHQSLLSPPHSENKKSSTVRSTKPTKVPITSVDPHDLVTPPHCVSRRTQTRAALIVQVPMISILRKSPRKVAGSGITALNLLKYSRTIRRETTLK